MRRALAGAALTASLAAAGCSPSYVVRAAYEEAKILWRRQPIEEILAGNHLTPSRRTKLQMVLAARRYADDVIGLDVRGSYGSLSRVDDGVVVYVVTAARRDRLESYKWWFPIVGRVPYKGYFSKGRADAAAERLKTAGYDTYVRPSAAFSTLGWFDDPLLATLLRLDTVSLLNIVFHELFHNTVYLAGESAFNESAANFVGTRSAMEFLCRADAGFEEGCREAAAEWQDALLVSRFLDAEIGRLRELYDAAEKNPSLLRERENHFDEIRANFARLPFRSDRYESFLDEPVNNASLLHDRIYYRDLDLFDELYRQRGDMRRSVEALEEIEDEADKPFRYLRTLIGAPPWQLADGR